MQLTAELRWFIAARYRRAPVVSARSTWCTLRHQKREDSLLPECEYLGIKLRRGGWKSNGVRQN